ncbi:KRAB-A domain-containing 2-like [Brachionus plicatilis]|uniref:KRAB-A domain-containing 2-like n=1 Tax=Brachionus plicatilis TaxID=10195 RepID=A0A3M7SHP2_BRAPC|nr:KRAB-A domain-containing 2-like [Brachionus plicatilis]
MKINFKKLKTIFMVILFSMVTDVESAAIEVENQHAHKENFYQSLEQMMIEKTERDLSNPDKKTKKTYTYIKLSEYLDMIALIEKAKNKKGTKTSQEYNILRVYDVITISETKKIIKKQESADEPIKYLGPYEDLFDTIIEFTRNTNEEMLCHHIEVVNVFNPKDFDIEIQQEPLPEPLPEPQPTTSNDDQNEKIFSAANTLLAIRAEIGDFVALPIPDVDKGLTVSPNLICRIIDIDYTYSLYELACEAGVFADMFTMNSFDKLRDVNLKTRIRTDKVVKNIRQTVNELSIGGGQGMIKCNSTKQCSTTRCTCRKSNLLLKTNHFDVYFIMNYYWTLHVFLIPFTCKNCDIHCQEDHKKLMAEKTILENENKELKKQLATLDAENKLRTITRRIEEDFKDFKISNEKIISLMPQKEFLNLHQSDSELVLQPLKQYFRSFVHNKTSNSISPNSEEMKGWLEATLDNHEMIVKTYKINNPVK